jgi:hypothetical protein
MKFWVVIRFIGLLKLVTIINYSASTNSHTLQFTTAHTKSSHSAVFTGCHLMTASNAVDSSASVFHCPNPCWLAHISRLTLHGRNPWPLTSSHVCRLSVFKLTELTCLKPQIRSHYIALGCGPHWKHQLPQFLYCCVSLLLWSHDSYRPLRSNECSLSCVYCALT